MNNSKGDSISIRSSGYEERASLTETQTVCVCVCARALVCVCMYVCMYVCLQSGHVGDNSVKCVRRRVGTTPRNSTAV